MNDCYHKSKKEHPLIDIFNVFPHFQIFFFLLLQDGEIDLKLLTKVLAPEQEVREVSFILCIFTLFVTKYTDVMSGSQRAFMVSLGMRSKKRSSRN